MTVTLAIFTDGRRSCISRAIPSALRHLHNAPISRCIISDDSADPEYQAWLSRFFPTFDIISGPMRLGFGGNIARAWDHLAVNDPNHYIFHLEDDFTFDRDVDLSGMIRVLDANPNLVQLALRRQPWNEVERAAGGIVESRPHEYNDCGNEHGDQWLEHRLFMTTNPSLYRTELCAEGWPTTGQSEGNFTLSYLANHPNARFGFWGSRYSGQWVTHIGTQRVGSGY